MPQFLHLPPVAQAILAITGFVLAIIRLLTASRPFWSSPLLPAWVQKGLPALLVALGGVPLALEHARSWLDVAVAVVVSVAAWYTASRGDRRPPEDKSGGARLKRVNSDPEQTSDNLPPDSAALTGLQSRRRRWHAGWAFAILMLVISPGCASLKPVLRTTNDIARALCGQFFSEKQGLSLEEAAQKFCETRDDLAPWIDSALAAKQAGGKAALARKP